MLAVVPPFNDEGMGYPSGEYSLGLPIVVFYSTWQSLVLFAVNVLYCKGS